MRATPPREGVDYYVENGLYVWTEQYLRRRGYCCLNGCRHCPYGNAPPRDQGPEEKAKEEPGR